MEFIQEKPYDTSNISIVEVVMSRSWDNATQAPKVETKYALLSGHSFVNASGQSKSVGIPQYWNRHEEFLFDTVQLANDALNNLRDNMVFRLVRVNDCNKHEWQLVRK